jgi:hypothetical protein
MSTSSIQQKIACFLWAHMSPDFHWNVSPVKPLINLFFCSVFCLCWFDWYYSKWFVFCSHCSFKKLTFTLSKIQLRERFIDQGNRALEAPSNGSVSRRKISSDIRRTIDLFGYWNGWCVQNLSAYKHTWAQPKNCQIWKIVGTLRLYAQQNRVSILVKS